MQITGPHRMAKIYPFRPNDGHYRKGGGIDQWEPVNPLPFFVAAEVHGSLWTLAFRGGTTFDVSSYDPNLAEQKKPLERVRRFLEYEC